MSHVVRLTVRITALFLVAVGSLGCVLWPEGSGPGTAALTLAQAVELRDRGEAVLIDVRSADAYAAGHIPGAVNVPAHEAEAQAARIRKMARTAILYCG